MADITKLLSKVRWEAEVRDGIITGGATAHFDTAEQPAADSLFRDQELEEIRREANDDVRALVHLLHRHGIDAFAFNTNTEGKLPYVVMSEDDALRLQNNGEFRPSLEKSLGVKLNANPPLREQPDATERRIRDGDATAGEQWRHEREKRTPDKNDRSRGG